MKVTSTLEAILAEQIEWLDLPTPIREYRFCERRWRFDFAWPDRKLAVECEGGIWQNGRHNRGKGFAADCEKYSVAALFNWRVIRVTGAMIRSGQAIELLEEALKEAK